MKDSGTLALAFFTPLPAAGLARANFMPCFIISITKSKFFFSIEASDRLKENSINTKTKHTDDSQSLSLLCYSPSLIPGS